MSPLQKVAMGLVIVFGGAYFPANPSPSWERYDALPDPIGWLLVLAGVHALTRTEASFATARWLAALAGAVSVPLWLPQLSHRLDASGQWALSLPQIAFCLWVAREIGVEGGRHDDAYVARRFGPLVWGFAAVAVLPALVLGAGVEQLQGTAELVSTALNVALVYLLFRVHRREWLGGPGPLEVDPAAR